MDKEYVSVKIEIVKLDACDILTASGGGGQIEPGADPKDPFDGGYDLNGWT
jgi:hypothetical protein